MATMIRAQNQQWRKYMDKWLSKCFHGFAIQVSSAWSVEPKCLEMANFVFNRLLNLCYHAAVLHGFIE